MKNRFHCQTTCLLLFLLIPLAFASAQSSKTKRDSTKVLLSTSLGDITIALFDQKSPLTVRNFLAYVDSGFYHGTIFHRVIPGFVIQGGGFTKDFAQKPTYAPIQNEAQNGVRNSRGTLSMARTTDPH